MSAETPELSSTTTGAWELRIREALAAGPTPGEWRVGDAYTDDEGYVEFPIISVVRGKEVAPAAICLQFPYVSGMQEANAKFFAAACPDNLRELLAELDRLRAEMAGVLNAGAQLSNCAFNLAQRDPGEFTQRDADALDRARKDWDAARTPKEPGSDLQAGTVGGGGALE